MSWSKQTTLWCDGDDCDAWQQYTTPKVSTARNWAEERHGWDCSHERDLCNNCNREAEVGA